MDKDKLAEIRSHYTPEMRVAVEALDRAEQRWRQRRRRQFVVALVTLVAAYAAAVATTWLNGESVAVFVILPLYALFLLLFYGPFALSTGSRGMGYSRSSVEATPSDRNGQH